MKTELKGEPSEGQWKFVVGVCWSCLMAWGVTNVGHGNEIGH